MGTLSSEIFDYFLTSVNDYKLDNIYQTSGSLILDKFLEPWLLNSIVEFNIADQDLSYTVSSGSSEGYFDLTLTNKNQFMLVQIMSKYWLQKEIQDVLQMNNILQDRDYRVFSQSNNLKAKQDYYTMKKEEIYQRLIDYEYAEVNWANWRNQIFYS